MSSDLRVLVFHRTADVTGIESGYHEASRRLADVPGLLGNELLHSVQEPDRFVVVSAWRDLDAFRVWEESPGHRVQTAPLRSYRDVTMERPFGIYRVAARYRSEVGPRM